MSKVIRVRPVRNKTNGQITASFRKGDLPKSVREGLNSEKSIKFLKFRFEGYS